MKKRIIGLLVTVLVSCFAVNVNAEIKDCSNENYSKVKDLSFEDYKEVTSHTISDSVAKIEDGKLTISIATRNDPEMNVNSKYTYDGSFTHTKVDRMGVTAKFLKDNNIELIYID